MSGELATGLAELAVRRRTLAAGAVLFRAGDPVQSMFLVEAGQVRLLRALPEGGQITLQLAGPGAVVAEASLFAAHYHCDAVAGEPSRLAVVPRRRAEAALAERPSLARAWARHLAEEVQRARAQAEILSLRRVAERLDAWLALHGDRLPPKGRRRQMASEIGVTPEALYRALAKRR